MLQNSHSPLIRALPGYNHLPRPVVPRVDSLLAGTLTPWHKHDWWQLSYALSGVLTLKTAQGSYMAPPQRAIWIPPGTLHEATNASLTEMRGLYIDIPLMSWAPDKCRVVQMTPLARELIVAVSNLPEDYDINGAAGRLTSVLIDQLSELPEVAFNLPMPTDPRLARICEELQAHPDDTRTMSAWGKLVGLSERSLTRLFADQTGLSFGDWRQRLRLLLALAGLERGEPVTHISMDSGYASPSAFIAAFRRNFGVTPTEMFRRRGEQTRE
jgi:AraC-like DNA-binding protein